MKKLGSVFAQLALLVSFLILTSTLAQADVTIRVHMIDARTGKPILRKPVRMRVLDAPTQFRPGYLQEKTDSNGVATFMVSDPIPEYLWVHIGMGGYWEECSPSDDYKAKTILDSGLAIKGTCSVPGLPKASLTFEPKPGEVYLFAVHLNLWEWIRYCGRRNGCGD
jgi:hypothetical protein